jgi:hypothetical protein
MPNSQPLVDDHLSKWKLFDNSLRPKHRYMDLFQPALSQPIVSLDAKQGFNKDIKLFITYS